jgi:4'-phosphopantetheinyl transferase
LISYPPLTEKTFGCVHLSFVKIDEIVYYLLNSFEKNYRVKKPLRFSTSDFSVVYFSCDEIEKLNSFRTLKKQYEWLSGRFCTKYLAEKYLLIKPTDAMIDYEEEGSPYLNTLSNYSISISHSGNYAAAALCDIENVRCGLDLEKIDRPNTESFMKIAYTQAEQEVSSDLYMRYTIWTAKEAYLKYIKKGFHETLKNIEYIDGKLFHNNNEIDVTILTEKLDDSHLYTLLYGEFKNI